jgi:HAD superfamily hydrolase (TIGR01509 family)
MLEFHRQRDLSATLAFIRCSIHQNMLAGIIFDFDGVIVDSHPVHIQAWKAFFASMGKAVGDEELAFVMEGAKRDEILRRFLGGLTPEQIELYGAEKERLYQTRASELKLIGGITEFLEQLDAAGMPMAVATSGSRNRVERTLKTFGLLKRFHAIVTAEDVTRGKPDPALFCLAASRLRVAADQILVCEDALAGVAAAKSAGMKCMAIAANSRRRLLQEAGADLVIEDFTQIGLGDVRRICAQPVARR